jgi:hypothetical protein
MVGLDLLPTVRFDGDLVTIEGVRNFRWRSLEDFDRRYETRTYNLHQVETLWFCLSVFTPEAWRGPAHSLLSFGFADGRYLAISVEARRERGEDYSIVKGMLRRFEVIYVIGDEQDLIANRAALRKDSVELYPIKAKPGIVRAILKDMLLAANRLHEKPQFYNTFTNNCTTRLRDHVNDVAPGRIPHSWKVVLPGYADELLESLGLIQGNYTLEEARKAYDVKSVAAQSIDAPDFSARIRAGLPTTAPSR